MLQNEELEPSRLRRSQCAAHGASEFRGFCAFEVWGLRFLCLPGEWVCRPRFGTAEGVYRLSVRLVRWPEPNEL
jgi:hypothetical protein